MSDDDYEQAIGTEDSEPAEPEAGAPAADDSRDPSDAFEAGAPAETQRRVRIPRGTPADRKAMAEAVAKFAADKAARGDDEDDEGHFGAYDEQPMPRPKRPAPPPAAAPAAPVQAAPPAPSLDPEVTRARQAAQAERDAAAAERAAAEKARESLAVVGDYEAYLESPAKAYRGWMEAMRGEKMTDDEYRQECADFVTHASAEVLGVKLPDEVKARMEAQMARKAISAYRVKDTRRQLAETNRRETERVEAEWKAAARNLDGVIQSEETSKSYPWLAAEDSPGSIIVDVIQSAQRRDGTTLSWQEASKQANDYLKKQASGYFDKRKHLLAANDNVKGAANDNVSTGKQDARPGRPPGPSQVTRAPSPPAELSTAIPVAPRARSNGDWSREAHRRETKRAFAQSFKPED